MTQTARVLRVLQAVGARGVTQADFIRWPTPDGGPPITRLAARIEELGDAGHTILRTGWRDKCTIYVLDETTPALAPPPAPPAVTSLFDPPPAPPRNALDDDWAA